MSARACRTQPHICFVATGLARGGAEVQLFHAATGLRARGFDVSVICMLGRDYWGDRLVEHGIPVTYLNVSRTSTPLSILTRFLPRITQIRPDAVAGFDYPGAMLARTGGWLARVPVVVSSIHCEEFGSWVRRRALAWTDRCATATTAVSTRMRQKLIDNGASPERVYVVPNGIDVAAVSPDLRRTRRELRQSLGISDGDFLWLAVGRFEEPKDYPNLITAMSHLARRMPHARLAIAGHGPLEPQVRESVSALQLDSVVRFLGFRGDAPALMAAADATVLASAWEGLPNVVIESLAVGTPIVCTDVGGIREVVDDGTSGLIVPRRAPERLADAMATMMSLPPERREAMGAVGRDRIEQRFALAEVVDRWSNLFTTLLATA